MSGCKCTTEITNDLAIKTNMRFWTFRSYHKGVCVSVLGEKTKTRVRRTLRTVPDISARKGHPEVNMNPSLTGS